MGNGAARDTEDYRAGYPGKEDNPHATRNLQFYQNRLRSSPGGDLIDVIHKDWFGNYRLLESHHGFIQWLFPIREHGMNSDAQVLQLHEAQRIAADPECRQRVVRSYALMLDFYGMRIASDETGELQRSAQWRQRYSNLNHSSHNWLRVTRILKSLGELGFEHFKLPFLVHVAREVFDTKELQPCRTSLLNYWCMVLRNRDDQVAMNAAVRGYAPDRSLSFMAAAPPPPPERAPTAPAPREEGPDDPDAMHFDEEEKKEEEEEEEEGEDDVDPDSHEQMN